MPRMRFNHMELTFPRGALDEQTRADIRSFYCDGFGWSWVDFPVDGQIAPMLVPDDKGQFLLLVESDDPMQSPGFDHLGLLLDADEDVDSLADFCRTYREKDERVQLHYDVENLVLPHSRVHFFYVKYLLPIYFDVSAYSYDPGFEPRSEWRLVKVSAGIEPP